MAEIADTNPTFNGILLDREKYFKTEYENLPIPNLDMSYFDTQNSIDLMDFSPILGALFISYKNDICIIEKDNLKTFWIKDQPKVIKRISILPAGEAPISQIKLSSCNHMLAVATGNNIKIYTVKDLVATGTAKLLTTFVGDGNWEKIHWGVFSKEKPQDVLLGINAQKKLYSFNLQTGQSKSSTNQQITCATFSSSLDHILAVNDKNEFIVFKAGTLDIVRVEKIEFIEPDNFNITTLTHIEEIKPNIWLLSGVCNDMNDPGENARHTYMVSGDIVTKKLAECPAQLFNEMFMSLIGFENLTHSIPYYKFVNLSKRGIILSGITLGNEVTMILSKTDRAESELKKYFGLEIGAPVNVKLKAPMGMMSLLRGFVLCTTRLVDTRLFEFLEADEERSIPYPPLLFVLTSCGQIGRYALIDKRREYEKDEVLQEAPGIQTLTRTLPIKEAGGNSATSQLTQPPFQQNISVTDLLPAEKTQTTSQIVGQLQSQPQPQVPKQNIGTGPSMFGQAKPQEKKIPQANESMEGGIIIPEERLRKEIEGIVKNKIIGLKEGFKDVSKNINENVVKLLAEDNKKFYREWTELESRLYRCRDFLKTSKKFFAKQNFFYKNLHEFLGELEFEAGMIKELVVDQIIEGKKILGYRNTELNLEIEKCKKHFNTVLEQMDYIEDFIEEYSELYSLLPTSTPDPASKSPMKTAFEKSYRFQQETSLPEGEFLLNLQPISKSLKMSKVTVKAPEQKLLKPQGSLKLSNGLGRMQNGLGSKNAAPKGPTKQTESEFQRQLIELSLKFKESLNHTADAIHNIKTKLNNLNKKGEYPKPLPEKPTPSSVKRNFSPKKQKKPNRITFSDSESDESESQEPVDFFTNILRVSQSYKLTKTNIDTNPLHKFDAESYKGPKLEKLFETLHTMAGKKYVPPPKAQTTVFSQPLPRSGAQQTSTQGLAGPIISKPTAMAANQTNQDDLTDKKTGLLNFSIKNQEEAKKEGEPPKTQAGGLLSGAAPKGNDKPTTSMLGLNVPKTGEDKKPEAGTDQKPTASIFGNNVTKTVEEKKPTTGTTEKPAASIFSSKPQEEKKTDANTSEKPASIFGAKTGEEKKPASVFGSTVTKTIEEKKSGDTNEKPAASIFGANVPKTGEDKKPVTVATKTVEEKKPTTGAGTKPPVTDAQLAAQKGQPKENEKKEKKENSGLDDVFPSSSEESKNGSVERTESESQETSGEEENKTSGPERTVKKLVPPPKDTLKASKSVLGDMASLDSALESGGSTTTTTKDDKQKILESLINQGAEDENIPIPTLVRDDSFMLKPEQGPKVDFFKTMTGRPNFLPPKQEKKDDVKLLQESLGFTGGQSVTLFTKKVNEPKKEENKGPGATKPLETISERPEEDAKAQQTQAQPPKQETNNQTPIRIDTKPNPIPAFGGTNTQATQGTSQNQPSAGFLASGGQKPAPTTQQTTTTNTGFGGLNFSKPGSNMFQTAVQNNANPQNVPQNMFGGQPSTGGQGNRFAIGAQGSQGGSTQNMGNNAPAFGSHGGLPKFGGQAPSFGHSSGGGVGFGQSSMISQPKPQNPAIQTQQTQAPKIFGSGSTMFGSAGQTQNTQGQGQGQGQNQMLFSAAVTKPGGGSFFGSAQPTGSNQPASFGGGAGAFGAVRKTKQI